MKFLDDLVQGTKDFCFGFSNSKKMTDLLFKTKIEFLDQGLSVDDYDSKSLQAFEERVKSLREERNIYLGREWEPNETATSKAYQRGCGVGIILSAILTRYLHTNKQQREKFCEYQQQVSKKASQDQQQELEQEKAKGSLQFLKDAKEFDQALKEHPSLVVDFYGIPCAPCKALAPVYHEVAEQMKDRAYFANLNAWEAWEISDRYKIRGVPTVIIFENGKPKDRFSGFKGKQYLEDFLSKNLLNV